MLGRCLEYREIDGVLDKTPTNEELHLSTRDVTDSWWPCTCHFYTSLVLQNCYSWIFCCHSVLWLVASFLSFLCNQDVQMLCLCLSLYYFIAYEVSLKMRVWGSTFKIWFSEFQSRSKASDVLYISFESDANGLLKGLGPERTVLKSSNNL